MKCAASLSISSSGVVVRCWLWSSNADVNGARNILAAGHAVLACGGLGQSGRLFKPEPTSFRVWAMLIYPVFQLQARQLSTTPALPSPLTTLSEAAAAYSTSTVNASRLSGSSAFSTDHAYSDLHRLQTHVHADAS